jgi:hypothetical protein
MVLFFPYLLSLFIGLYMSAQKELLGMDKSIPQQQFGFGGSFRTANLRCAIAIKM